MAFKTDAFARRIALDEHPSHRDDATRFLTPIAPVKKFCRSPQLVCLDAVLEAACKILTEDFSILHLKVQKVIANLSGVKGAAAMGQHGLSEDSLRVLKNEISRLEGRIGGFVRALHIVLVRTS